MHSSFPHTLSPQRPRFRDIWVTGSDWVPQSNGELGMHQFAKLHTAIERERISEFWVDSSLHNHSNSQQEVWKIFQVLYSRARHWNSCMYACWPDLIETPRAIQQTGDLEISNRGVFNHYRQNCRLRIFVEFHSDLLQSKLQSKLSEKRTIVVQLRPVELPGLNNPEMNFFGHWKRKGIAGTMVADLQGADPIVGCGVAPWV